MATSLRCLIVLNLLSWFTPKFTRKFCNAVGKQKDVNAPVLTAQPIVPSYFEDILRFSMRLQLGVA